MAGPWDELQQIESRKSQAEASADQGTRFQVYNYHPQQNKPVVLRAEIEKTGIAEPQPAPRPAPPRQFYGQAEQPRQLPYYPPLNNQTAQPDLQGRNMENYRNHKGQIDMSRYLSENDVPVIAGFKRQTVFYDVSQRLIDDNDPNSDDRVTKALAKKVGEFLFGRNMSNPSNYYGSRPTTKAMAHYFDFTVARDTRDGERLYFGFERMPEDRGPQIDNQTIEGELYTDYTYPQNPRRYFIGVVHFELLDHSQRQDRAVVIPMFRSFPNRRTELAALSQWFATSKIGDDELNGTLANLNLPQRLLQLFRTYPANPNW